MISQGRRRCLKSGTAIERYRHSARAKGSSRGKARAPSRKGGSGDLPLDFFEFIMSVEAILLHFETIFACEIRLIVQAFHVAVIKCVSNPHH